MKESSERYMVSYLRLSEQRVMSPISTDGSIKSKALAPLPYWTMFLLMAVYTVGLEYTFQFIYLMWLGQTTWPTAHADDEYRNPLEIAYAWNNLSFSLI